MHPKASMLALRGFSLYKRTDMGNVHGHVMWRVMRDTRVGSPLALLDSSGEWVYAVVDVIAVYIPCSWGDISDQLLDLIKIEEAFYAS